MYVRDIGNAPGPVLVLIHGGGVGGWMWDAQIAHFRPRFRVLVPDLPGHDRSGDRPFTTSTDIVAELARMLEDLPGSPDITVVGFSLGAQIALELATARPDLIARAVITSGLTEGIPLPALSNCLVRATAPLAQRTWFARLQAKTLFVPEHLMDDYLRTSRELAPADLVALTKANAAFRIPAAWREFPGAALLLAGGKEPRSLLRGMTKLANLNPRSELVVHERAGHGLPMQDPAWFNARVDEWLARVLPV